MKFAVECGFKHRPEVELSLAVTELLTNALKFGTRAIISICFVHTPHRGLQIVTRDNGPGFENIELAPQDGYSDGRFLMDDDCISGRRGLGVGLGAVARLTDKLKLKNLDEGGASVTIWKWLP